MADYFCIFLGTFGCIGGKAKTMLGACILEQNLNFFNSGMLYKFNNNDDDKVDKKTDKKVPSSA